MGEYGEFVDKDEKLISFPSIHSHAQSYALHAIDRRDFDMHDYVWKRMQPYYTKSGVTFPLNLEGVAWCPDDPVEWLASEHGAAYRASMSNMGVFIGGTLLKIGGWIEKDLLF